MHSPSMISSRTHDQSGARKLRFSRRTCETHLIESHLDFSEEEMESIWYNGDDYRRMRNKNIAMQRMIKNGYHVKEDDKHFCFRGVIHDELRKKRTAYREEALELLCREQRRQYMSGVIDEEKIRSVLLSCSQAAAEEAIVRAQADRLAALDQLTEEPSSKLAARGVSPLASALAFQVHTNKLVPYQQRRGPVCNDKANLVSLLDDALAILDKP